MHRAVKIGAVTAALAGVVGLGALAWAADSSSGQGSPPAAQQAPKAPAPLWHRRGDHGGLEGWSPARLEQALERDPAKVAERAQTALDRVQKRKEALSKRIADAEAKLGTIQDPDLKRLAEARLEVARANLTQMQKMEDFLKVLIDVARSRAPSAAPSAAPSGATQAS